jgi:hypothetical protein
MRVYQDDAESIMIARQEGTISARLRKKPIAASGVDTDQRKRTIA